MGVERGLCQNLSAPGILRQAQHKCRPTPSNRTPVELTPAGRETGPRPLRLFFAFWIVEGSLTVNEQHEVKQRLKEMDMPMNLERPIGIEASASMRNDYLQDFMNGFAEGFAKGYEIGRRTASLEHARKVAELGVSWEIITSAIGIKPEDLAAEK